MAYSRLNAALSQEIPVLYSVRADARAVLGMEGAVLDAFAAALGGMEFCGTLQTYQDGGGYLDASAMSGGRALLAVGQMARDGRVGLNINGAAISADQGQKQEAASMLMLDGLGQALLEMGYEGFRAGNVPFLTSVLQYGHLLWQLATPYGSDNNRLSAPSGPTSHAMTYLIDTEGLRSILVGWAGSLHRDDFVIGLKGTGLSLGPGEKAFDAFVGRVRGLALSAELSSPIKLNLIYGTGDLLQVARGSGTIRSGGRKTNISYTYTCSMSSTRVTRKYYIDFQPKDSDTLVLECTWLTSSNNTKSGAHEVSLIASGVLDGQPYRVKINSEMVNRYAFNGEGQLAEVITGTASMSVKYGGIKVLDVAVKRRGETLSAQGAQALSIVETLETKIATDKGTVFAGDVIVSFQVEDKPSEAPDLTTANPIERLDFSEVESMRKAFPDALDRAMRDLARALPMVDMGAIWGKD